LIHARTTLWLLVVLALPLVRASAQEMPAPTPIGVALPTTPTWDQVIDGDVDLAQLPAVPGSARAPATAAPPTTGRSLRNAFAASNDPNNPFASINQPGATSGTTATTIPGAPRLGFLQMIGDLSPLTVRAAPALPTVPSPPSPFPPKNPPSPPSPRQASALASSVRGFKIAENQSPQPQDRVFYSFNYYNNLNAATDKRFDTPINNLRAYREIFGFEKTFDQGRASFGMILPLDTLYASSTITGNFAKPGGTSTSVGDLSVFTKFIVRFDEKTGSLFSGGLLVTTPTGPSTFAGAKYISAIHTTTLSPYMGYILRRGKFYLHGFSSFAFPINPNDVSLIYNDAGIGYFLYQDTNEVPTGWITAIVPTTEVHVNTPLNHQNVYNANDIAGSANVVNLTQGLNVEFHRRSILTFGIATPITSPKPFDLEALLLFNVRFGGSRRTLPPILGG
jgi:hypothetical protein